MLADTSLLVAGMVESHPAHIRALPWLQRAKSGEVDLLICSHSLAELYAVLTTLPVRPRIGADLARRLIRDNVESCCRIVSLSGRDYQSVLNRQSSLGLIGGTMYDALIAHAAQKAGVENLLSLNEAHFRRVWPEGGARIAAP